jgi:hypothetical protein
VLASEPSRFEYPSAHRHRARPTTPPDRPRQPPRSLVVGVGHGCGAAHQVDHHLPTGRDARRRGHAGPQQQCIHTRAGVHASNQRHHRVEAPARYYRLSGQLLVPPSIVRHSLNPAEVRRHLGRSSHPPQPRGSIRIGCARRVSSLYSHPLAMRGCGDQACCSVSVDGIGPQLLQHSGRSDVGCSEERWPAVHGLSVTGRGHGWR